MRTFLALLVGLSVTAFASQALAQDFPTTRRGDRKVRRGGAQTISGRGHVNPKRSHCGLQGVHGSRRPAPVTAINNDIDRQNRFAGTLR